MATRKSPRSRAPKPAQDHPAQPAGRARARAPGEAPLWIFGAHPVLAALANPRRRWRRLLLGTEAARRHGEAIQALLAARRALADCGVPAPEVPAPEVPAPEVLTREGIGRALPEGAVHQGLALLVEPLPQPALEALLAKLSAAPGRLVIVVLDQLTDPHNVGAVLRSAAAFGAAAVITTRRNAAPESGALAKAASGALEHVPYLQVANLARAIEALKRAGFWSLGLSGEADKSLAEADPGGPLVLVLGAEGPGLRRLTRAACDLLARLPTRGPIADLNVSNAAAVALYELLGRQG